MKSFFVAAVCFFSIFTSVLAGPVAVPRNAAVSEKRQYDAELSILNGLFSQIQTYTGQINATVAALPADADDATKAAASAQVNSAVSEITGLITAATASVPAASLLRTRQVSAATIAELIGMILLELSGTLNSVIAALGLTSLLGFLTPLTLSLSGLILALELVVDNLLAVVEELLDGILTGLSIALAGLTL